MKQAISLAALLLGMQTMVAQSVKEQRVKSQDNRQEISNGDIVKGLIRWPDDYRENRRSFFVHNEIDIAASPETVWKILVDVYRWQEWYSGASNTKLEDPEHQRLQPTSIINWKTMGLSFRSPVREYIPHEYLAWESLRGNIRGYHVWLIIPTSTGCKVITDEAQRGWLTFFEKIFQPQKLHRLHDVWLQSLKQRAENQSTSPTSHINSDPATFTPQ